MEEKIQLLIEAVKELGTPTILDFTPILLSVIAIMTAIFVPWRIAHKQNDIALFDKIYDSYSQLLLTRSFASAITKLTFASNPNDSQVLRSVASVHFESAFGYKPDLFNYEESLGKALAALRHCETKAHMLPLLIAKTDRERQKCEEMISAIYEPLFSLVTGIIMYNPNDANRVDELIGEFATATESFFTSYAQKADKSLRL